MRYCYFLFLICFITESTSAQNSFVTVKESRFYRNNKPYHYIGTNYWYGALLGTSDNSKKRLIKELDELKQLNIQNLRILVGAEGGDQDFTVREPLQPKQGVFDEEKLKGLDFLLDEMGKRNLTAILYLTNNWEWSGGLAKYLEWNNYGTVPNPNIQPNTWPQFMTYTAQFHQCNPCIEAFENTVKKVVSRTNSVNGKKYKDDTTIMAWEVANEPRVFTPENEKPFTIWIQRVVDLVKKIDPNHLITTGSEGKAGSNDDIATFERTHNYGNIDYLTMHIWPKNWGWYNAENEEKTTPIAIEKTLAYIEEHIEVAKNLKKPLVLEEFGFPRERESLDKKASLKYRNQFYNAVFERMNEAIKANEPFVALNFWGYGGFAVNNPKNGKWSIGDDYTTDPPQEPQGLNTVFSSDTTTIKLITSYSKKWNP